MSKRVFKTELDAVNASLQTQVNNSISKNIVDAKGDIVTASAADTPVRLAVGTNEQRLVADSATTSGLKYVADTTNYAIAAKGDLLVGTAADTVSALTAGNNGDTLLADSSASVGLRYQEPKAGNPVINSAFQVWQRGTSFSIAASTGVTYTADRWATTTGANQAITVSRQVTNDTTNLPNIQYCVRYQRNSGQTGTGQLNLAQSFETVNAIPFAGKTVTFSFYARKGADYSATSSALTVKIDSGTGTDQNILSGDTGGASPINSSVTLTTTWQRFSITGTIATTATEFGIYWGFTPVGTASTNDYYEVTGVQLEVGSVATPFKTQGVTLQGELAACQRYYYRTTFDAAPSRIGTGFNNSTTETFVTIPFPVVLRTRPTALEQSGTAADYSVVNAGPTVTVCSAIPTLDVANVFQSVIKLTVASGLTSGAGAFGRNVNTNAYLGWSAEL